MPNQSLSNSQVQKGTLSAGSIQLQQLLISQNYEIEQIVNQELSQNPALVIEDEPISPEDITPDEDDKEIWNQDFDKPYDEYETGERLKCEENSYWGDYDIASSLEQIAIENSTNSSQDIECALKAINLYRISGALPEEADHRLQEDLRLLQKSISYTALPSISPTFEIVEESGNVQVHVVSTIGDSLNYRKGFGKYSQKAKEFINKLNRRSSSLNSLATIILEDIQGDFFCQPDINNALKYLIPINPNNFADFEIEFPFTLDKKMMSKLGDLLVESKFGIFPLGFFLPSKAVLVRLWIGDAQNSGITKIKDQCEWITEKFKEQIYKWESNDRRLDLVKPLLEISINDIKNARKK